MTKLLTYLTILATFFAILGGLYTYDQSKADASDLLVVREQIRLIQKQFSTEQKIRREQVIQERLWTLEDRYQSKPLPQSVREEIRNLKKELEFLRRPSND